MKHVFGIGSLPLIVDGITDPQVNWFNWYWGPDQGVYAAGPVGTLYTLYAGVSLAGPKLTPETFQQGLFAMPAFGGAASNQLQSFMFGYGRTSGLPYDEYSQVGLDYALMWWNPDEVGKGKIIFDEGTGKFMYPNDAKRYYAPASGRRASRSCSTRATRSRTSPSSRRATKCPTTRATTARARAGRASLMQHRPRRARY